MFNLNPTYLYGDKIGYVTYVNHIGPDLNHIEFADKESLLDESYVYDSALRYNTVSFELVIPSFLYKECFPTNNRVSLQSSFYHPKTFTPFRNKKGVVIDPLISYPRDNYACMPVSVALEEHGKISAELYSRLVESGISHEQAQMVLPQNIYIKYDTTIRLGNVIDFFELTEAKTNSKEAYKVAETCFTIIEKVWPNIILFYKNKDKGHSGV